MKSLEEILQDYLQRGFGTMTKNDFEVWIFNQLLKQRFKDKTNYEISRDLKIPESKVKRLRYEADLKYSSTNEIEHKLYDIVNSSLRHAYIKVQNGDIIIQFVIEDQAVRKYLDFKLKQNGFFSDSSFNSEIVTVRSEALESLYNLTAQGKAEFKLLKHEIKSKSGDKSSHWFKDFLMSLIKGSGETIGKNSVNLSMITLLNMFGLN